MDLLKSIDVFREVCRQMSFSQAADRLNLVPSAVSRQISGLEKHLGVRLLERTTRSIRLTDDGTRCLRKMDEISRSVTELRGLSPGEDRIAGRIRLTAPPLSGPQFLTAALDGFCRENPEVSISTTLVNREVDLIEEGYDMALRVGILKESNLIARVIGTFSLSMVASPGYIEARGKPTHPRDLAAHSCLINTLARSPRRWRFRDGKRGFSVKVDGMYDFNDDGALRDFAIAGHGIANLPGFIVREQVENGDLVALLRKFAIEPLPVCIVYPSRELLSPAKRALIDYLIERIEPRAFA